MFLTQGRMGWEFGIIYMLIKKVQVITSKLDRPVSSQRSFLMLVFIAPSVRWMSVFSCQTATSAPAALELCYKQKLHYLVLFICEVVLRCLILTLNFPVIITGINDFSCSTVITARGQFQIIM